MLLLPENDSVRSRSWKCPPRAHMPMETHFAEVMEKRPARVLLMREL